MFVPTWVILLVVLGVICYFNPPLWEFINKWTGWAFIAAFVTLLSPFIGCLALGQHVFKWEKDDWKTQLLTIVGGFGLYYLVVFLFFAPK